jgi:DNA-binding IclR family transcriptional regulator
MNNSVLKGLSVLELLEDADRSMTLAEISRKAEIPKSTALGILRALVRKRFVEVEEGTRYRLGLRVFEVGTAYLRGVSPSAAANPELVRLVGELGIAAHFAILDGVDVVYLEKEDPAHANVLLASAVGTRLAAHHTAVGQAHLAAFSEEDLVRTLGPGPFGYLDGRASWTLDELKDRLAKVRQRGYAMDNEETLENVQCVAAPVLDATGSCRGAVGVSFLKTRFGLQIEDVATPVMAAAGRASERLGHRAKYTDERV